jgi:hypothetical protein
MMSLHVRCHVLEMSRRIWDESQSVENTQDKDDWFRETSTEDSGKSQLTMQEMVDSIH